MSAPESSNSKAPPSLLPSADKTAQPGGSRILANLEGRVDASASANGSSRSRAPWLLVALLVIAAGGFGAWQVTHRAAAPLEVASATSGSSSSGSSAAAKPAVANAAASNAGVSGVPGASVAGASAVAPTSVATSAMTGAASAAQTQPATIVADDSDAATGPTASAPLSASSPALKSDADSGRLSRALADGAKDASAPGVAAHASQPQALASTHAKHDSRDAVREAHENSKKRTVVAQAKRTASKPDAKTAASKDSDVDLLAALVAHTEPYKAGDRSAKNGATATKVSTPASGSLADQVKACGERGFFSDQLCLWRVCDGHWGKDPSCPNSAAQQARQP